MAGLEPQTYVLGVARVLTGPMVSAGLFALSLFTAAVLVAAATFSVATMVSDQISLSTLMQSRRRNSSAINVGRDIMHIRRAVIALAVAIGCLLAYQLDSQVSSTIGLLFGSLIVQLLPALIAAMHWRGANRFGAGAGMVGGVLVWLAFFAVPQLAHLPMNSLAALCPGGFASHRRLCATVPCQRAAQYRPAGERFAVDATAPD